MKPIFLALLLVSSVLAAPSVVLNQYSENEIARPKDNGRPVSSYVSESGFDFVDGGDTNVNILTLQRIINDIADQPDPVAQSIAIGQTLGLLTNLATGIPGDACTAAALINAYAHAVQTGDFSKVRLALGDFIKQLARDLKLIVKLAVNPESVKYAVGPTGGCVGGGRTYRFEGAWDAILGSTNKNYYSLIHEEYCTAKRLYYAFNSRSNIVGATVTALSLPPVVHILETIRVPASIFLKDLINGRDSSAALARTQQLLLNGINSVPL